MANEIIEPDNKDIECICPRCGAEHVVRLFWTGRGKPKKLCHSCRCYSDAHPEINREYKSFMNVVGKRKLGYAGGGYRGDRDT